MVTGVAIAMIALILSAAAECASENPSARDVGKSMFALLGLLVVILIICAKLS